MSILTKCSECSNEWTASVRTVRPLCDTCRRKHGFQPWKEMTPEEKVEDLNRRLKSTESRNTLIG